MKVLHYNLYEKGHVGMCNLVMSLECAVLIAKLTKRDHIVFYGNKDVSSASSPTTIFDLYDINFSHEVADVNEINQDIPSLPCGLHNTCLYYLQKPTDKFVNGRANLVDLSLYEGIDNFRTLNNETLAFYSYLFFFQPRARKELLEFVKDTIKPKQKYLDIANSIVTSVKNAYPEGFNSTSVRRGDYLWIPSAKNKEIGGDRVVETLKANFPTNELLMVHTDEVDHSYFKPVRDEYSNIFFVQDYIREHFSELNNIENGLVSLIVGSHSNKFVGTMYSTYSAYFQRYRLYNGLAEDFRFLYPQHHSMNLVNGRFKEEIAHGTNTWNRIKLDESQRQIAFWFREWPECYPNYHYKVNPFISIYPSFLSDKECQYILDIALENKLEYFQNEHRNRININLSDPIMKGIVDRACERLMVNPSLAEASVQVFTQHVGGKTGLHVDSIYEDEKGRRLASVLFYLNPDKYQGSEVLLPNAGVKIVPDKGMMVSFPLLNEYNEQDEMFAHETTVIESGESKVMFYYSIKEYPDNQVVR